MTYFLKLYPPLIQGKEGHITYIEENQKAITVSSIVNKVLNKSINLCKYKPEDLILVVNNWIVNKEYTVKNGDYVKVMFADMYG